MNICVIGGGNIGTQFACICASKKHIVKVYTSKPELFSNELEVVDEFNSVTKGSIVMATSCLEEAVRDCQIIIVTFPAFKLQQLANELLPYIKKGMSICVIPGTGGAEFAFEECIQAGACLLGLQRVPSVARLEQYGKRVRCEGLRDKLYLAAIPSYKASEYCDLFIDLWGISCEALPNYLNVTLIPSNPILHTTRLKTLFDDYQTGKYYAKNPLFYGEWSDKSSELLLACDEELQQICRKLIKLDLQFVRSLKQHYESETVNAMTKKISSIKSLHNLYSPMKETENGWIPDFKSRYFTADFPFGLNIICQFADIVGVDAPNIHDTMEWYKKVTQDMSGVKLSEHGIKTINDIYELYQ